MKKKKNLFFFFGIQNATDFKEQAGDGYPPSHYLYDPDFGHHDPASNSSQRRVFAVRDSLLWASPIIWATNSTPKDKKLILPPSVIPEQAIGVQSFAGTSVHGVFLLASDTIDNVDETLSDLTSILGDSIGELHRVQGEARPGSEEGHERKALLSFTSAIVS